MTRAAAWFAVVAMVVIAGCNPQIDVHMPEQEPVVDDETLQWFVDQTMRNNAPTPTPERTEEYADATAGRPTPPPPDVPAAPVGPTSSEPAAPETPPAVEPAVPVEEHTPAPSEEQSIPCTEPIGIDGNFAVVGTVVAGMEHVGMQVTLSGTCESRAITYLRIGLYRIPPQGNVSELQDICDVFSCDCTVHACGPLGPFGILDHRGDTIWLSPGFGEHPAMYSGMPFRMNAPNRPIELRAYEELDLSVVGTIRTDAPAGVYQFALLDLQEMWPSGFHDFRRIGLAWPAFTIVGERTVVPMCSSAPDLMTHLPFDATTYVNPDGEVRVLDISAIAPCEREASWGPIDVALYRESDDGLLAPEAFCDIFRCDDGAEHPLRFTDGEGSAIGISGNWLELVTRIVGTPYRENPYEVPLHIPAGSPSRLQLLAELREDAPPGRYVVNLRSVVITYDRDLESTYSARTQRGPTVIVSE